MLSESLLLTQRRILFTPSLLRCLSPPPLSRSLPLPLRPHSISLPHSLLLLHLHLPLLSPHSPSPLLLLRPFIPPHFQRLRVILSPLNSRLSFPKLLAILFPRQRFPLFLHPFRQTSSPTSPCRITLSLLIRPVLGTPIRPVSTASLTHRKLT